MAPSVRDAIDVLRGAARELQDPRKRVSAEIALSALGSLLQHGGLESQPASGRRKRGRKSDDERGLGSFSVQKFKC